MYKLPCLFDFNQQTSKNISTKFALFSLVDKVTHNIHIRDIRLLKLYKQVINNLSPSNCG